MCTRSTFSGSFSLSFFSFSASIVTAGLTWAMSSSLQGSTSPFTNFFQSSSVAFSVRCIRACRSNLLRERVNSSFAARTFPPSSTPAKTTWESSVSGNSGMSAATFRFDESERVSAAKIGSRTRFQEKSINVRRLEEFRCGPILLHRGDGLFTPGTWHGTLAAAILDEHLHVWGDFCDVPCPLLAGLCLGARLAVVIWLSRSERVSLMLHAVIMAGGFGTRFWPLSRAATPKQLLDFGGGRTMIQQALDRLSGLVPPERTLVITNRQLVGPIREQLPELPAANIVGEPCKRDTAPCVGLAAHLVAAGDPDATMLVMPADHLIQPVEKFRAAISQASELVQQQPSRIVT